MFKYLLYRIGHFIAIHFPLKAAYAIAVTAADIRLIFADKDRAAVKDNLKAIFPDKTITEIRKIRRAMFRNFAKYLVDFFRFSKIDKEYIKQNIHIENIRNFDEAASKKKGVVVLTAHLGNWELGGVVIAISGYPFWAVALPHKNNKINDFFNYQRMIKGVNVIPYGHAVRKCLDVLNKNELVALVGDRDFSERGILLDFFGRPSLFPPGPAAFSLRTGANIVPGFMLRNNDDSFTLRIERPIEFKASGNKDEDEAALTKKYISIFEDYIRKYPDQWYMFRRFWKQ